MDGAVICHHWPSWWRETTCVARWRGLVSGECATLRVRVFVRVYAREWNFVCTTLYVSISGFCDAQAVDVAEVATLAKMGHSNSERQLLGAHISAKQARLLERTSRSASIDLSNGMACAEARGVETTEQPKTECALLRKGLRRAHVTQARSPWWC